MANHSGEFINDKNSRTGNLKFNLVHEDMVYAARKAGLAFIVNVVLNGNIRLSVLLQEIWEARMRRLRFFVRSGMRVKRVDCDIAISTKWRISALDREIFIKPLNRE